MANPPITIGPFTTVPAPGSAIVSPWAQQLSRWAWEHTARLYFNFGQGLTSAANMAAIQTVNVPAADVAKASMAVLLSMIRLDSVNSGNTGLYTLRHRQGTTNLQGVTVDMTGKGAATQLFSGMVMSIADCPAGTAQSFTLRGDGTAAGQVRTYANTENNLLVVALIPNY